MLADITVADTNFIKMKKFVRISNLGKIVVEISDNYNTATAFFYAKKSKEPDRIMCYSSNTSYTLLEWINGVVLPEQSKFLKHMQEPGLIHHSLEKNGYTLMEE